MKYIIFRDPNEMEFPIIFPECLEHETVANRFSNCIPISAGKCKFYSVDGKVVPNVWGESMSLKLKSCPVNDLFLIEKAMEFRGC